MFLTVLVWAGAVTVAVELLDWLLRDKHKRWITDRASAAWVWLDDQRAGKFTSLLLARIPRRIFAVGTPVLFALGTVRGNEEAFFHLIQNFTVRDWRSWIPFAGLLLLLGPLAVMFWVIHSRVAGYLGTVRTLGSYFLSILCGTVLGFGLFTALVLLVKLTTEELGLGTQGWIPFLVGFPVFILGGAVVLEAGALFFLLYASFCWLILVYVLSMAAGVTRFILLRVAEHPKGPVIALGALASAVSGLVKLFLSRLQ